MCNRTKHGGWYVTEIPALRMWKQEGQEFKAILNYILSQANMGRRLVPKTTGQVQGCTSLVSVLRRQKQKDSHTFKVN